MTIMKKFVLSWLLVLAAALVLPSCCRDATEWNFRKWERKKPFEHKLKEKKSKKGIVIRYKNKRIR